MSEQKSFTRRRAAALDKATPETTPESTQEATQEDTPTHIVVRSLRNGFRRAGRPWSTDVTTVPLVDLSDDQLKALLAEPMLVTFFTTVQPDAVRNAS